MPVFVDEIGIPFLLGLQNGDGGWGHRSGLSSCIEPTGWSVLALACSPQTTAIRQACKRAQNFLHETQLRDGSWPSVPGEAAGCWVTSIACLALYALDPDEVALRPALDWICNAWPAEGGFFWHLRTWIGRRPEIRIDHSLRGWSWTPGTASWIEPTSYALILLRHVPFALRHAQGHRRIRLAEQMLFNRTIATGGWNCGDPQVYGVPGIPRVGPTAWALLALQAHSHRIEVQRGLSWLESVYNTLEGPTSLALAYLCLQAYKRSVEHPENKLRQHYARLSYLGQVNVMAWMVLALLDSPQWLARTSEKES